MRIKPCLFYKHAFLLFVGDLLPKQLGFLASSIMKDIVKSNLQLNLQRKNEYYVNAKR